MVAKYGLRMKLLNCGTLWLEVQGAVFLILVGAWYLLPMETFSTSQVYRVLSTIMPETFWGVMFLTLGACYVIAILALNYNARRTAAFLSSLLFMFFAVLFFIGSTAAIGALNFLILALSQTVAFLVQKRNGT
jgi:hypothetical protein